MPPRHALRPPPRRPWRRVSHRERMPSHHPRLRLRAQLLLGLLLRLRLRGDEEPAESRRPGGGLDIGGAAREEVVVGCGGVKGDVASCGVDDRHGVEEGRRSVFYGDEVGT
eukprot:CAMPEP_0184712358 /NCGR_PEP_ID=MMETSP0314-20130426/2917_1 /TAXON_ID=38298 /ORGANISM="Rhodella maculata, Strain CCMP 736" /LENGTH=110 /DNA_ID=CAMNT_0027174775 /DNA_START=415 /DNA_END=747 /DNA_ORIENTATION=-